MGYQELETWTEDGPGAVRSATYISVSDTDCHMNHVVSTRRGFVTDEFYRRHCGIYIYIIIYSLAMQHLVFHKDMYRTVKN